MRWDRAAGKQVQSSVDGRPRPIYDQHSLCIQLLGVWIRAWRLSTTTHASSQQQHSSSTAAAEMREPHSSFNAKPRHPKFAQRKRPITSNCSARLLRPPRRYLILRLQSRTCNALFLAQPMAALLILPPSRDVCGFCLLDRALTRARLRVVIGRS